MHQAPVQGHPLLQKEVWQESMNFLQYNQPWIPMMMKMLTVMMIGMVLFTNWLVYLSSLLMCMSTYNILCLSKHNTVQYVFLNTKSLKEIFKTSQKLYKNFDRKTRTFQCVFMVCLCISKRLVDQIQVNFMKSDAVLFRKLWVLRIWPNAHVKLYDPHHGMGDLKVSYCE